MTFVPFRGMNPHGASGQGGLTARPGGGAALATQLPAGVNRVETVATAADSVILPSATPGAICWVINATATSMQVFAQPSNDANPLQAPGGANVEDTIAAAGSSTQTSGATGVAQAANIPAIYVCAVVGQWKQYLCAS